MFQDDKEFNQNEQFISNYMKYHNYEYFDAESIKDHGFFYLHLYHYYILVDLLLKEKEKVNRFYGKLISPSLIQYSFEYFFFK